MLLVSGIYDLGDIPTSFLKDEARMTPAEAADWSPLMSQHHAGPRRLIAVGADETPPFHDQAAQLHQLCRAMSTPCDLLVQPALNHMNVVLDLADPARPLGRALSDLVISAG